MDLATRHAELLEALWVAGRYDAVEPLVSDGYELGTAAMAPLPAGERGVRTFLAFFGRGLDERGLDVLDHAAEGGRIATRFVGRARQTGSLGALPPTGRAFTVSGVALSDAADERFARTRLFVSDVDVLRQLGLLHLRSWIVRGAD